MFLYKTLARISKTDEKYYALEYAEALAKSGKWDEAVAMLKPLADDFTKHGSLGWANHCLKGWAETFTPRQKPPLSWLARATMD
ncbi:MAG: hypothetical protein ACLUKN_15380 [Bacilli bacterium]